MEDDWISSKLTAENAEIAEKEFRFVNSAGSANSAVKIKELRMAKKKVVKGLWSKADINTLARLFPKHATAEIATKLGRPTEAVKKKASRMGLRKSKGYMKSLGRA